MKYVLYHSNCYDGFGAAYAAWKKFSNSAVYIAVSYGKPPPDMPNAEEIYIVDFSYDSETLKSLANTCKVVVLDHHKTAEENLRNCTHPNLDIIFDMGRSGALIAWEYFHSDKYGAVPENRLIRHISDRDLWKFEMPGSKEIHSALVSRPMDFEHWDSLDVELLKIEGEATLRMYDQLVEKVLKNSFLINFLNHEVPVVNTSFAWSEVGDALKKKYPKASFVMSFTRFGDNTMFSVRSKSDFDSTVVSKKFGGGGHAQASGFKTSNEDAEEILMNTVDKSCIPSKS